MPPAKIKSDLPDEAQNLVLRQEGVKSGFIGNPQGLKYECRSDIKNRATLERNLQENFEALSCIRLADAELARPLDEIGSPEVFAASKTLCSINSFGTPLIYTPASNPHSEYFL